MWIVYWEKFADADIVDHVALVHFPHMLSRVIAFLNHGDGGRTQKKGGIDVENWQVAISHRTAGEFWKHYNEDMASTLDADSRRQYAKLVLAETMQVNFKGWP